jgi:hypothetical protein
MNDSFVEFKNCSKLIEEVQIDIYTLFEYLYPLGGRI